MISRRGFLGMAASAAAIPVLPGGTRAVLAKAARPGGVPFIVRRLGLASVLRIFVKQEDRVLLKSIVPGCERIDISFSDGIVLAPGQSVSVWSWIGDHEKILEAKIENRRDEIGLDCENANPSFSFTGEFVGLKCPLRHTGR